LSLNARVFYSVILNRGDGEGSPDEAKAEWENKGEREPDATPFAANHPDHLQS